jgi:hypothetical protein
LSRNPETEGPNFTRFLRQYLLFFFAKKQHIEQLFDTRFFKYNFSVSPHLQQILNIESFHGKTKKNPIKMASRVGNWPNRIYFVVIDTLIRIKLLNKKTFALLLDGTVFNFQFDAFRSP